MKNRLMAFAMFLTLSVLLVSCATSKKYGCPMVQVKTKSVNS
jgi:hypothetical protein